MNELKCTKMSCLAQKEKQMGFSVSDLEWKQKSSHWIIFHPVYVVHCRSAILLQVLFYKFSAKYIYYRLHHVCKKKPLIYMYIYSAQKKKFPKMQNIKLYFCYRRGYSKKYCPIEIGKNILHLPAASFLFCTSYVNSMLHDKLCQLGSKFIKPFHVVTILSPTQMGGLLDLVVAFSNCGSVS